eukprot:Trichotokara_eunicae@DN9067_c0_g1_i1.p1
MKLSTAAIVGLIQGGGANYLYPDTTDKIVGSYKNPDESMTVVGFNEVDHTLSLIHFLDTGLIETSSIPAPPPTDFDSFFFVGSFGGSPKGFYAHDNAATINMVELTEDGTASPVALEISDTDSDPVNLGVITSFYVSGFTLWLCFNVAYLSL